MIRSALISTLLLCSSLNASGQLPVKHADHNALDSFLLFMGGVRTATPYAGAAKTKAINLFTELFKQADPQIKVVLNEFVDHLNWIMKRKLMLANTKNKLCLLLLNDTRTKLEELAKGNPEITVRIKKLISAIYTSINPTFGDFWRTVRVFTAVTGSIAAATYLGYQIYNLKTVLETESGPFNQLVKLLVDLHKVKDPTNPEGPSEFIKFITASTQMMTATEAGPFSHLMVILKRVNEEEPKLLIELIQALNPLLAEEEKGSFGHLMDILKKMPEPLLHGSLPPIVAYLKAKTALPA